MAHTDQELGQVCGQAQGFPKSRSQDQGDRRPRVGAAAGRLHPGRPGARLSLPPSPGRVRELGMRAMWAASLRLPICEVGTWVTRTLTIEAPGTQVTVQRPLKLAPLRRAYPRTPCREACTQASASPHPGPHSECPHASRHPGLCWGTQATRGLGPPYGMPLASGCLPWYPLQGRTRTQDPRRGASPAIRQTARGLALGSAALPQLAPQ